jgi:hypothetical protein
MFEFSLFTKYTNRNFDVFLNEKGIENKMIVSVFLFSLFLLLFLLINHCFEKKCIAYLGIKYYKILEKDQRYFIQLDQLIV